MSAAEASRPSSERRGPVVVAVVDDGIRLDHEAIRGSLWRNPGEIPGNGVDDDANGHVDDVHGWDVADDDADARPPIERLETYYHGTHVASVVLETAREFGGADAAVEIMVVKAISDEAEQAWVHAGYEGIAYALSAGADIILCAFSGGRITSAQEALLRQARDQGVLVVGAAGNFYTPDPEYPGAHPAVLAVANVGADLRKNERSNHGRWVDLSAPGDDVDGALATTARARGVHSGTSLSSARVAAGAAVLAHRYPDADADDMEAILQVTATPTTTSNPALSGFLGAGQLDMRRALALGPSALAQARHEVPAGVGVLTGRDRPGFVIAPTGLYERIDVDIRTAVPADAPGSLRVFVGTGASRRLHVEHPLAKLPRRISPPEAPVEFELVDADTAIDLRLAWRAIGVDLRSRYCRGLVRLDEPGPLTDGSGDAPYSAFTECRWLITAPEGKRVRFMFPDFDTQTAVDRLYFFDGGDTGATIMAMFSGPESPPTLVSWHEQVLVWFLSDGDTEGQGFHGTIEFIDPEA
ncbi:MAG TPA: S8 family serine peptidase [Pseudomonadales bacterium]|nr:S8 family serine peptidase [Pseudomonadales bacterium]